MKQEAGRKGLGDLAPKFAELNDDVLFGEIWSREELLSPRDRSMITIAGLFGKGIVDGPFESHIRLGKELLSYHTSPQYCFQPLSKFCLQNFHIPQE